MATPIRTSDEPASRSTPERVAALREIAERDQLAAQDAAWEWFERLGKRAKHDQETAADELAELFACGQPSRGIDGRTDGILVAPMIHPVLDTVMRSLMVWPNIWLGKRFDAATATGDNLAPGHARWILKLVWPFYGTRDENGTRSMFDFETRVEPGGIEPSIDVLVIDYAHIQSNPRLVVRRIRDELVEIVPGAHLGRILWHQGDDRYTNLGYFALRTPAS